MRISLRLFAFSVFRAIVTPGCNISKQRWGGIMQTHEMRKHRIFPTGKRAYLDIKSQNSPLFAFKNITSECNICEILQPDVIFAAAEAAQ